MSKMFNLYVAKFKDNDEGYCWGTVAKSVEETIRKFNGPDGNINDGRAEVVKLEVVEYRDCHSCDGLGLLGIGETCPECDGEGRL